MRGVLIRNRVIRLSALAVVLFVFTAVSFWNMFWMKSVAEAKISEFIGDKFEVRIGEIKGGIFGNTVLQDVAFRMHGKAYGVVFRLERVEISYRVWQAFLDKLGLVPKERFPIKEAGVYFSKRDPLIQGFIKIYSSAGAIDVFGSISSVIFGEDRKKVFKGEFNRRADGLYDCDIFWDGNREIKGIMDPANKSLEFSVFPVSGRIFVEKGVLGELEFVSMFATLSGNLPVIKVSDARVVKNGGHIIMRGEVDLSKMKEDKAIENLFFETDNKVAVWENWQISKDEGPNKVEARKDRLVFSTSFEGDQAQITWESEKHQQQDMWFKYKLDEYNSFKMEMREDGDFLGVEHKVQF